MAVNSKAKGNTFERNVSGALSSWLTDGKETRACWRSDSSGASATIWSRKGREQKYVQANAGDIRKVAEKGEYPALDNFFETYVVECKAYKEIDFYPPFGGTLVKFFEACIAEKKATGKKAVLILKGNNRKILYLHDTSAPHPDASPYFTLSYKDLQLTVYLFDDVVKKPYVISSSGTSVTNNRLVQNSGL